MKVLETKTIIENKYSRYKTSSFVSKSGRLGSWEYIERTNNTKAVIINAYHPDYYILVKQFRVPMSCYCLEFPAGLIDAGEEASESAIRELEEETGYSGRVVSVSPLVAISPGLSSECVYWVNMVVEGTQQAQKLDDCEEIEVVLIDRHNPIMQLKKIQEADPTLVIDSKVWITLNSESQK